MWTDKGLEGLLRQGGEGYARRLAEQLEPGQEETFSPRFEAAMEAALGEAAHPAPKGGGWQKQLRAAGLALVCLAGLGAGAMRVEAIRVPLLDFLVGEQGAYTQVQFPSLEGNDSFRGEVRDYLPTWVPEGYRLESVEEDSRFIYGTFVNDEGERFYLTATPSGGSSVMLDREDAVVTQTEIGTRGAFIAKRRRDDRVLVLMFDNDYAYTLTGYLTQSDAEALMKSIPGAG